MHLYIVDEQPDFLVVYKPPGLPTIDGQGPSLRQLLFAQVQHRPLHPVHRLDKDTSGLLLFAKTDSANADLSKAFRDKKVAKIYLAITDARPKKSQGSIVGDMQKSRNGSYKLSRSRVNPAVTEFFSLGIEPGLRLIVLKPETGKTHQLRVALRSLSAPILGDERYGGSAADRMYLHACLLSFELAGQRYQYFVQPREGIHFQSNAYQAAFSARCHDHAWFQ